MAFLLHQLIVESAQRTADAPALLFKQETLTYQALANEVARVASGLRGLGIARDERVAVYLPKQIETVTSLFGAMAAGGVFVPVNPILKPEQVGHILRDCATRVLITSVDRAGLLSDTIRECPELSHVIVTGGEAGDLALDDAVTVLNWEDLRGQASFPALTRIDADVAAILYTSGSTGRPKGVVLSHHNMLAGARSVDERTGVLCLWCAKEAAAKAAGTGLEGDPQRWPVVEFDPRNGHARVSHRGQDYAVRLVLATHPQGELSTPMVNQYLRFGASPRAAQAMVLAGKVKALLDSRGNVSVDDIRSVALPAMRHRILLNFEGEAEGMSQDEILQNIVETLPTEVSAAA